MFWEMTNYIYIITMYFKAIALWHLIKKKGVLSTVGTLKKGLKQVADVHHNALLHSYMYFTV